MANPSHTAAIDAVAKCNGMKPEDAREYLELLACAGIHFMRAKFGDDYARGWLEHALSDLDRPPMIELRKPQ